MPRKRIAALVVLLPAALLVTGCGGEPGGQTTGASTSVTAVVAPEVEVVKNLVYHSESAKLSEALLDVYAPVGVEGGPVVVIFHGLTWTKGRYMELATAIAEQGAVVFVADWTKGKPSTADIRDGLLDEVDGSSCAVSYALAHAGEYGADPETLILFGHSAGANEASMIGLRQATPLPECAVEMTPFVADGMVLWEGDWLISEPTGWDGYGESLPLAMGGITPWSWLATGPRMAVALVTTAGGVTVSQLERCGVSDPAHPYWLRDPDGWFREQLEAAGALEDGCISGFGDSSAVLADIMREQGFDVVELLLEESTHTYLSPEDQALLVAEIIAMADR